MAISDKVAATYAEALLSLAEEAGQAAATEQEFQELSAAIMADPVVWGFFRSPLVQGEVKMRVVDAQLKSKISTLLYNFLGVLAKRRRFINLPEIVEAFSDLLDRHLNRRRVEVRSAVALTEGQVEGLKQAIEHFSGQGAILTVSEDASLLGGLVIRSGDLLIDSSMRSKLAGLRQILMHRKILGEEYYEN